MGRGGFVSSVDRNSGPSSKERATRRLSLTHAFAGKGYLNKKSYKIQSDHGRTKEPGESMNIRDAINKLCRELLAQARQNDSDAREFDDKHAEGFADAQRWAYRKLKAILKDEKRRA